MLRLRPRSPKHRQLLPSPCIFRVGPEARQKTYFESPNAASFFRACVLGNRPLLSALSYGVGARQCQFSTSW